jgi:hypothetical protein
MQTKKWRENLGDISIIARRLEDGHVQYGWSGIGGLFLIGEGLCIQQGTPQGQQQNSEDLHLDGSAATDAPFLMLPSGPSSTDVLTIRH